ncbi:MAG: HlyD family efflux transporter periplasmic adaptor subunit [Lachnospiraceae bacterium]|nr:HlyD family efflux transporter periplasmic adaptor subunit [Lachnospiraceae bacterium]
MKTLEVSTVGGVLTASELVATIVPDDAQMLAEVEILNQDIGYVQTGQEAAIKLDTYNFQDYGKLEGVIVSVSPDAIWDEQKGWVYKGKVCIDLEEFKQRNTEVEVAVGMEGTAEVKVDERRILDFFLEPLVEHFDGSLKVR